MFGPQGMGYDRAITIFSPDGRLYQVEYAIEAVRRGWSTLGIKVTGGVVLAAEQRIVSSLAEVTEKIQQIDDHIGISFSGFFPDARVLIDKARTYAQIHRLLYDEPILVETLAKRICDILQIYTQHGGVRPFGVALLIGGVDDYGPQLIGAEPSGAYMKYYAHSLGSGESTIESILEKEYRRDMSIEEAIQLALKALKAVMEGNISPERVELAVIDSETRRFRKFSFEEKRKLIEQL